MSASFFNVISCVAELLGRPATGRNCGLSDAEDQKVIGFFHRFVEQPVED